MGEKKALVQVRILGSDYSNVGFEALSKLAYEFLQSQGFCWIGCSEYSRKG